jgi:hypothetical protein
MQDDYPERVLEAVRSRLAESAQLARELGVEVLAVNLDEQSSVPELVVLANRTGRKGSTELRFRIDRDFGFHGGRREERMDVEAAATVVLANVLEVGA